MPGRDGSGPTGRGAMTGRGLGYCTGSTRYGYGRPRGLGLGYGRGYRRFAVEPMEPRLEKELMEEEKELLQRRIEILSKRLDKFDDEEK